MSKFKILVNCRNDQKLQNVLTNMDGICDCISTSGFAEDIKMHVECFDPDMFLSIFETLDFNTIQQYYHIKSKSRMNGVPFVLIASPEVCKQSRVCAPDLFEWIYSEPDDPRKSRILLSEAAKRAAVLRHEPIVLIGDDSDPSNRKHILVVDDDKVTLRLLKTAQEEKFYNVTALANGKVAEKYLQTKTVDLILLDYQMPIESGAEVLKNIPVIFLTGVSDSDRVQEVISMKPQGYLLKPVNMECLFVMIRNLI